MAANRVVKTYTWPTGGTFTAPGGVSRVKVTARSRYVDVGVGNLNPMMMLSQDGILYEWGVNSVGELGNATVGNAVSSPTAVAVAKTWKSVFATGRPNAGSYYGIDATGVLYGWGSNTTGQLGVGDTTNRSSPSLIQSGLGAALPVAKVVAGALVAFLLTPDSNLYAMGANSQGELGVGNTTKRSSPTLVLGSLSWQDVVVSRVQENGVAGQALGLTTAGAAYAWGDNVNGQLGVGNVTARSSPVAVLGGLTFSVLYTVCSTSVATGSSSYGLTTAGAAYAWGANSKGELGVGDTTPRSSPVAVLGSLVFSKLVPMPSFSGAIDINCVLGLTTAGAAYAWGANANGQLGDGTVVAKSSPVAVLGGLTFTDIFVNGQGTPGCSMYGLTAAGALYAWGYNAKGELGVGDTTPRSSPVAVLGGLTFAKVVTDNGSVFAVTTQGIPYAWGANANGQLGTSDTTARSSPVLITPIRSQLSSPLQSTDVTVVPGTSYSVTMTGWLAYFGSTLIGYGVDQVQVEYTQ